MTKFHFTDFSSSNSRVSESEGFGDHAASTGPGNDVVWRLLWRELY